MPVDDLLGGRFWQLSVVRKSMGPEYEIAPAWMQTIGTRSTDRRGEIQPLAVERLEGCATRRHAFDDLCFSLKLGTEKR
jgi:hypothetical protein